MLSQVEWSSIQSSFKCLYIWGLERGWRGIHLYLVEKNFINNLKTLSNFSSTLGHSLWTASHHGRYMWACFICGRVKGTHYNREQNGRATALTCQNQTQEEGLENGSRNSLGLASTKAWVWSPEPTLQKLAMVVQSCKPSHGEAEPADPWANGYPV